MRKLLNRDFLRAGVLSASGMCYGGDISYANENESVCERTLKNDLVSYGVLGCLGVFTGAVLFQMLKENREKNSRDRNRGISDLFSL